MSINLNHSMQNCINFVLPFQFEDNQLRGRLVRLSTVLDIILSQHTYPALVSELVGEAVVLAAALGSTLKYDGLFTLQIKSEGNVSLLVADVKSDGGIRSYARFDAAAFVEDSAPQRLLGKGYLAFTVDQHADTDRYQGIVELREDSLSTAVQHYFRQSEQIPTGILAAARQDAAGHWHAGCLMVQCMPREGGIKVANDTGIEDSWHRAMLLLQTCTPEELTDPDLRAETLLYRLFHEDGVRVHDKKYFRHECRCSESKVVSVLRSLPRSEIETMAVDGIVSVDCEFCNRHYVFDHKRRDEIFSVSTNTPQQTEG